MNNAINTLPLSKTDRIWIEQTLDLLPDEPVTDYDLPEFDATVGGRRVAGYWEAARSTPVIRYADHRPAKTLDSFGPFDPIPSRQHVLDALAEAAEEWGVTA